MSTSPVLAGHSVFQITSSGTITEVMDAQGDGAGHPLDTPIDLVVDSAGNVHVAGNSSNNVLRIAAFPAQSCGDAIISVGETCDDGFVALGDGCDASCQVELGYDCTAEPSVCIEVCGDEIISIGETCDDGGTSPGDGCDASCQIESGYGCAGEPSDCGEVCGDAVIAGVETCDDGSTTPGDGCDSSCQVETGFNCFGLPSVCAMVPSLSPLGIAMLCGLMGLVSWRRLRNEARR